MAIHPALRLAVFLTLIICIQGWSGPNVCSRSVCVYRTRKVCVYRTSQGCCAYKTIREPTWVRRYFCCPGYTHNGNERCDIPICNPPCKNGGVCVAPNTCRCPPPFSGPICSGATCSYLRPCFPGICNGANNCVCQTGFSTGPTFCLSMDTATRRPDVYQMQARMSYSPRGGLQSVEQYALIADSSDLPTTDTLWTNRREFNALNVTAQATFDVENLYPRPNYVTRAQFGVVRANINIQLLKRGRNRGDPDFVSQDVTEPCPAPVTSLQPETDRYTCAITNPNFDRALENGDTLTMTFRTEAGGFESLLNTNTNRFHENKTFSGGETSKAVAFKFDFAQPTHCFESSSCRGGEEVFSVGNDITKAPVVLTWSGWEDLLSGVFRFAWEVFRLQPQGNGELAEPNPLGPLTNQPVLYGTGGVFRVPYNPPEPGMYSFILEVGDRANNTKYVRRLVLYDPTSNVSVSANSQNALFASSALSASNFSWVDSGATPVVISWRNHFRNKFHEEARLLNKVRAYPPSLENFIKQVPTPLDDNEGRRTVNAIPNVRGVVRFEVAFAMDQTGGSSFSTVPNSGWRPVSDLSSQTYSIDIAALTPGRALSDGTTVTAWVRATDILGNWAADRTRFHVDASPPSLTSANFVRNQQAGGVDFSSTVEVEAADEHSGIERVDWEVTRSNGSSHSNGSFPVQSVTAGECGAGECVCVAALGRCFRRRLRLGLSNCLLMVERESLPTETLTLTLSAVNPAQLSASRTLTISDLPSLNGTDAYLGPRNIRTQEISNTGAVLTWAHAPSCYERTELWIRYRLDLSAPARMEKIHRLATTFALANLAPATTYTVELITQYGEIKSDPVPFTFTTGIPESAALVASGGNAVGIAVGSVLLLVLAAVVLFMLWRRGMLMVLKPRGQSQRHRDSVMLRQDPQQPIRGYLNSAYVSGSDDIYMYGTADFRTAQPWHVPHEELSLLEEIATGRFAKIYKARWTARKSAQESVVAKILKEDYSEDDYMLMMAKINFAASISEPGHPNILKFLGAVVDNNALGPVMVTEYCETGQLDKWLVKNRNNINDDTLERLMKISLDIARAMDFLTAQGIVHRKLAARNVLLTFVLEVKVMGFGPLRLDENAEDERGERIPIKWTAPECMSSLQDANEASDVWSYGVVMWEIFSLGESPYSSMKSREVPKQIKNGYRLPRPEYCEDLHYSQMQKCWNQNPSQRPTFAVLKREQEELFTGPGGNYYYYRR